MKWIKDLVNNQPKEFIKSYWVGLGFSKSQPISKFSTCRRAGGIRKKNNLTQNRQIFLENFFQH